jgi:hypothetical protein
LLRAELVEPSAIPDIPTARVVGLSDSGALVSSDRNAIEKGWLRLFCVTLLRDPQLRPYLILRDHLSMFKDQVVILEKQLDSLSSDNETPKSVKQKLEQVDQE